MTDDANQKATRRKVLPIVAIVARDICGLAGAFSLTYGVAQIYVPAAWIVGGALTVAICILTARGQRS